VATSVPHRRFIGLKKLDRLYVNHVDLTKGTGTALAIPLDVYPDVTWTPDAVSSSLL